MVTLNLYLDKRGLVPGRPAQVKICVAFRRKTALFGTGMKVLPDNWDARTRRIIRGANRDFLNATLDNVLSKWRLALFELTDSGEIGKARSAIAVRDMLARRVHPELALRGKSLFAACFMRFAQSRHAPGYREIFERTMKRIRSFDPEIESRRFEDIDKSWLHGFEDFLSRTEKSANSRAVHFRNIRAVFNDAIDDEITVAYPFRKFKIRQQATRKRALTVEQLRTLAGFPCEEYQIPYRDMFMLMFMLIGINGVDLFNAPPDAVVDGRLEYVRAKTHKPYSIKVEPEAAELLERYKGRGHLVWVCDTYSNYADYLHRLGHTLKQIGPVERHGLGGRKVRRPLFPNISQYWCRHTWATIAASLDIPKETIAAGLGHGGNTVTDIYIDFDRRKVDEANRRVLDWVLYGKR